MPLTPGFIAAAGFVVLVVVLKAAYRWWRSPRRRRHRYHIRAARRVLDRIAEFEHNGQKLAYLRKINPLTFEELILEAAARRGHKIYRNARYTGDGGIDGQIDVRGRRFLIQAKRYQGHINRQHLADFCVLVNQADAFGLFVHTGRTGEAARAELREQQVDVLSGDRLIKFLTHNPH